jgi:Cu+-exporting ATPase
LTCAAHKKTYGSEPGSNKVSHVMGKEIVALEVEGMTCTNCALSVEKYLKKIGSEDVSVNFATKEVRFRNTAENDLSAIKKGIGDLGYAVVENTAAPGKKSSRSALEKKFAVAAIFTFPLLLHMFLPFPLLHDPLFQLVLSIPVMYIGIRHFGKSAFSSVKNGTANMDVLIFIGSVSAFIYSIAGGILHHGTHEAHQYLFYETAATIITLVLLGNLIEERSVQKTTSSLKELLHLQKQKAKRIITGPGGMETLENISSDLIAKEDILRINEGDQALADGIVISGDAELDESLISGESTPVYKEEKSRIISGSMVISGSLKYRVTHAGKDSTLSGIIQLVKDAQGKKPSIQKLGDKVSSIFVPVVLAIALLTFIVSYLLLDITASGSLMAAVAVLVISCPCAMGLATPTAIMVGVGKGAKRGVLLKGGDTIEKLAKIKTIVFDKTGTLTNGKFKVKNFEAIGFDESVAKNIILHMEKISSHPIARSIAEAHADWFMMKFEYTEIREIKGKGIYAKDAGGNEFLLGSPRFVAGSEAEKYDKDLLLSYCGKVIAAFDIEDQVKTGVRESMQKLRAMGIKTVMLSGDNEKKCRYVAERTGIQEFYFSQMPDEKLRKISDFSAMAPTAMVGDGVNDAPALSKADVGISLGQATDIAKQSADVILMSGEIEKVNEAVLLGRKTYSTIRQNLFWALIYNVVAIPIAAAGMLSPMIGAISMAFSDIVVVGNSLRLNFRKIK